jgi:succinyl-diaminopimelate desuccinylase
LNGHLDTVKLSGSWTKEPFEGDVEGDKMYGVGSLDMKSGCAATMVALKKFASRGTPFKGKVLATYVSVEEGPYGMGTNALIDEGIIKDVDISIVTEPSSGFTQIPFPVVCLGARGGYGLEVEFFGESAHAALPKEGKSAALDAARFIQEVENIDYIEDEFLGKGAACVVAVECDGGACSVPDYAKVKLFWHIVVGEDEETIKNEIVKAIQRGKVESEYKISFRDAPSEGSKGFMPYVVDRDNPFVETFYKSVRAICHKEPETAYFQSIGDFNYLGSRIGAPVIIFGPGGEGFHGDDEYVLMSTVKDTSDVINDYLENLLRPE